jgi:hypothetical protein
MGGMGGALGGRGGSTGAGGVAGGGRGGTSAIGGTGGSVGGRGGTGPGQGGRGGNPDVQCTTNNDCVHYADGIGDCCGACLPRTAPQPPMISCLVPCMQPITCPCVAGKCTPTPVGGTTSQ